MVDTIAGLTAGAPAAFGAWIGVVSALGGVAVGGIVQGLSARAMFRREKTWTLGEQRKTRLEDVYEALDQLRQAYSDLWFSAMILVELEPATRAALNAKDPSKFELSVKVPWARLRMLVNMHFPELETTLAVVEVAGPNLGVAAAHINNNAGQTAQIDVMLSARLNRARDELTAATKAMEARIVSMSDEIALQQKASVAPVTNRGQITQWFQRKAPNAAR